MNTAKDIRLSRYQRFGELATQLSEQLQAPEPFIEGKLVRLSGMRLEVSGLAAGIGSRCFIETGHRKGVTAEVVGFEGAIKLDPSKPDGTPRKLMDNSLIHGLGWKPRFSLKEGIQDAYADFQKALAAGALRS